MNSRQILELLKEERLQCPIVNTICELILRGYDPTVVLIDGIKAFVKLTKWQEDHLLNYLNLSLRPVRNLNKEKGEIVP